MQGSVLTCSCIIGLYSTHLDYITLIKIIGFVCHFCHKSFGYKKTLDGHISVMHENSGAFPCEICGKKFAVKSGLQQHLTTVHLKEEKYKCEMCDKSFTRKDYFQVHL